MTSIRLAARLSCFTAAIGLAVLGAVGCSIDSSSSSSSSGSTAAATQVDVRTATCADIQALPSTNQVSGAEESLRAMAAQEGVTVTTEMQNAYLARLNSLCDSDGTQLWATAASDAYVQVTGGN
jgi:hypothetical protein